MVLLRGRVWNGRIKTGAEIPSKEQRLNQGLSRMKDLAILRLQELTTID